MNKANLAGAAAITLVLLAIVFLVLKPGSNDNSGKLNSVQAAQQQQRNSILKPSLLSEIEQSQRGALVVAAGAGLLPSGQSWKYENSWPAPEVKIVDSRGEVVTIPVSGKGQGGALTVKGQGSATELARSALNDPKLIIVGTGKNARLQSSKMVAGKVNAKKSKLLVAGLFAIKACKKKPSGEPSLDRSCLNRTR
jgi:hypothetical protein